MKERERQFDPGDSIGREARLSQTLQNQGLRRRDANISHLFILGLVFVFAMLISSRVISDTPDFTIPAHQREYQPPQSPPSQYIELIFP